MEPLLMAEDLHGLVRLAPGAEQQAESQMIVLELEHCRGCESTAFLTVKEKQITQAAKGQTKEKEKKLEIREILEMPLEKKYWE